MWEFTFLSVVKNLRQIVRESIDIEHDSNQAAHCLEPKSIAHFHDAEVASKYSDIDTGQPQFPLKRGVA